MLSSFGFSFSPIRLKRHRLGGGGIVFSFSPSLSTPRNDVDNPNSHRQTSLQQLRVSSQQFIVCSPLVCSTNKLKHEWDTHTNLSTNSHLADTDDAPHMLDSFEIGYNSIESMPTEMSIFGEQAPLLYDDFEHDPFKESRSGIRTRSKYQPSHKYAKIWEDIAPPSAAARARHPAVKARSSGFSEQTSQSLLKGSTESAGKSVGKIGHFHKKRIEAKKRRVVRQPDTGTTKSRSSLSNSKVKSNCRMDASVTLTDEDVLFGRGGGTNTHNIKFREEVAKFVHRYREAPRSGKAIVAQEIVNVVKGYGGRFLDLTDGSWYEADDKRAKMKVSQALRDWKAVDDATPTT